MISIGGFSATAFAVDKVYQAQVKKTIIVGGDYNYPPFEFIDKNGEPAGYNVDLTYAIASVMGVNVDIRLGLWDEARAGFDRGEIDIMQGIITTAQRQKKYSFGPSHSSIYQSLFGRVDGPKFESFDSLRGSQIIVQRDGLMHELLRRLELDLQLILVDTHADALRLLSSGKHDFAAAANLPGLYLTKELGLSNLETVHSRFEPQPYGYAVLKGNELLLEQFTQGMAILKNTGRQQQIYQQWFGAPEAWPWKNIGLITASISVLLLLISIGVVAWNKALRKKVDRRTAELAQQQLQLLHADKMASLGVLVSGVAHEINNPCGILTLNFPLLREVFEQSDEIFDFYQEHHGEFMLAGVDYDRLKTVLPETLEDMHNASRRIKAIVDDLTHFISKEESTIDFDPQLDLNQLVQTTVRLMSKTIEKSTSHFYTDYEQNLPTFEANGQRIEQVIVNLLLNACQALTLPSQSIKIKTRFDRTNQAIIFTIEDTGIGIDPVNLSRITDPFYTSKRSQGGTGLGLSVSAGIIRDHQGGLEFKSTLGQGTQVSLSLPIKQGSL